jgi:hypothetical protein
VSVKPFAPIDTATPNGAGSSCAFCAGRVPYTQNWPVPVFSAPKLARYTRPFATVGGAILEYSPQSSRFGISSEFHNSWPT